uniref:DLEC1 cilia and flagella associated protein n=1 Tax=Scleropages formosus TaxID=113540 RepID=A0A8C9RMB1_SCLFO
VVCLESSIHFIQLLHRFPGCTQMSEVILIKCTKCRADCFWLGIYDCTFPGEGGMVAPGMSCQYKVYFTPDSLSNFEDILLVETLAPYPLIVPIEAWRPPPILTLARILDCGYCLVGGVKIVEFQCRNEGLSNGTFCIIPKKLWPSVVISSYTEQPPFRISPSLFDLLPGEATVLEVCHHVAVLQLRVKNCAVLIAVVDGEDYHLPGEICDMRVDHLVRFGLTNPYCMLQKRLVIRNNAHLELPFCWEVMQPTLERHLLSEEQLKTPHFEYCVTTDSAFDVSPREGLLQPHQDHEFLLSYCPLELKEYHSVCHLLLRDIQDFPVDPNAKIASQHCWQVAKVSDVVAMTIEVKGSTKPRLVLLEPCAVYFPGENYIGMPIRERFKIFWPWNSLPGPKLAISVPSLDLGLIQLGDQARATLHITNKTLLEASWTLLERCNKHQADETQVPLSPITVEPCHGVLPMLSSCSVDVLFSPVACQHFETVLELAVENGTGCHLSVKADVQSPQACLLNCELVFTELYVGVPTSGSTTIFNQTLLPVHFSWEEVRHHGMFYVVFVPEADNQDQLQLVLDFGDDVQLERPVTRQLAIRNQTAIAAPFSVKPEFFAPPCIPFSPSTGDGVQLHQRYHLHSSEFVNSLLAHGKGATFYVEPACGILGPFETQTMDITAFTNMWGKYRDRLICKVGFVSTVFIPVKMNVRGCPLYFQITGPQVENEAQSPVIRFGTHVSGGHKVIRSLRLNNPSPCNIYLDWETFNQVKGDKKLLDLIVTFKEAFRLKDADGNEISDGQLGPSHRASPSSIPRDTPSSGGKSSWLRSEVVTFSLSLQVVAAGGSSTVNVSFTPKKLSGSTSSIACLGFALGFMSLDSKVRSTLNQLACLKNLFLLETHNLVRFASEAENKLEMPLSCRLSTQSPFSVLEAQPRNHAKSPRSNIQDPAFLVQMAFHNSLSLLTYLSLPAEQVPPTVQLMYSGNGERRLQFRHNLFIEYSNSSVQAMPLCAYLLLPTLHLSADNLDFGICYVGQKYTKEVFLYNRGGSGSYWTGSASFTVAPKHGFLNPLEFPTSSCRNSLQISFIARYGKDHIYLSIH